MVSFHTGGRKCTQNVRGRNRKEHSVLQGTEMLSDLWLLFFGGQKCYEGLKRRISQLCACISHWKHHCFLKLSQTEAFNASSRTADLPVLGLLSKRFLRAGECKGGGLSYFLVILKRTCSLVSNPLWKSLGAVLTMAVKNACVGCPVVITQHLQDAWIGEAREWSGELEA